MPTERKIYALLTGRVPFKEERNFSDTNLAFADATTVGDERFALFPKPNASISELRREGRAPRPFHEEALEKINARVKKMREETDQPFDELYHKERKLVMDIVRLEKLLNQIRDTQPHPMGNAMFNVDEIVDDHP